MPQLPGGENPALGYRRVHSELTRLSHHVSEAISNAVLKVSTWACRSGDSQSSAEKLLKHGG